MSVEFKIEILKISFLIGQNVKKIWGMHLWGVSYHIFRGHVTHDHCLFEIVFYKKLPNEVCITYPKGFGRTPRLCMKKIASCKSAVGGMTPT